MSDRATTAPVRTLRSAIEAGAPEAARSAATRLQTASPSELLEQLATAIEEERDEDAKALLQQLIGAYEARRPDQQATAAVIRQAQLASEISFQEQRDLSAYLGTLAETMATRAELLSRLGAFLDDGDGGQPRSMVLSTITETKQQESTREQKEATALTTAEQATLPPALAVVRFEVGTDSIAEGASTTATVAIENVGDAAATSVVVELSPPTGIDSDTDRVAVGRLEAGGRVEQSIALTGRDPGTYSLPVQVKAAETSGASKSTSLTVTATGPGTLPGQTAAATDPDGDGEYEDITGDAQVNVLDVAALLEHFDEIEAGDVEYVDFDENGTINILDVAELLAET